MAKWLKMTDFVADLNFKLTKQVRFYGRLLERAIFNATEVSTYHNY